MLCPVEMLVAFVVFIMTEDATAPAVPIFKRLDPDIKKDISIVTLTPSFTVMVQLVQGLEGWPLGPQIEMSLQFPEKMAL